MEHRQAMLEHGQAMLEYGQAMIEHDEALLKHGLALPAQDGIHTPGARSVSNFNKLLHIPSIYQYQYLEKTYQQTIHKYRTPICGDPGLECRRPWLERVNMNAMNWTAASYELLPAMNRCQLRTAASCELLAAVNRCQLWTAASYEPLPAINYCQIWTAARYELLPAMKYYTYYRADAQQQTGTIRCSIRYIK